MSAQIPIPEAALDKHVALLGMTGAGKTSVIKTAIVEPDLAADRRVLIITPKDDWWGLRLSKTGKSTGFDIPIFGGRHEDYPLQVKDAALLAETYGTMKGSAIFCTSRLSVQDRAKWFAAFAEKLLSANRGWVRVVIDEAHVFMPKQGAKGGGALPMALHAGNELVSQGRSSGLRIVLASQRSAKLHNDALTQCSCLIAMLLMAPHDRDAVKDWIEDQADPQTGKEIIASLATLSPGQAWVWAPGAKFLDRVQFARPSTFDSSAAPDDDTGAEHRLKPINLDALKGKLATVEAGVKANDPKALRARIVELERELKAPVKPATAKPANTARREDVAAIGKLRKELEAAMKFLVEINTEKFFKAGGDEIDKTAIEKVIAEATQRAAAMIEQKLDRRNKELDILRREGERIAVRLKAILDDDITVKVDVFHNEPFTISPVHTRSAKQSVRPSSANGGSSPLSKAERLILTALAQYPQGRSKNQIAILSGYAVTGGGFNNALSSLRSSGFLSGSGDRMEITAEGAAALGGYDPLPTGPALLDHWLRQLGKAEREALRVLAETYPNALSKDDLATHAGYAADGGGFNNALSKLRTLELIEGRGELRASENLFG